MADETPTDATPTPTPKAKKIRPDGNAIAIATEFPDDPDQVVQSWQFADGMTTGFKTAAQVADWTDV